MKRELLVGLLLAGNLWAEPFGQAKVSRAEGSVIRKKAGVETGPESKAELDFHDGTIARVGANARFSYVPGTRETALDSGTLLMSSPKDAGGVTVRASGTVTTASGAVDFEVANLAGNVKVICLSGKPAVYLAINPKARDGLRPGQMLSVEKGALKLGRADTVNLKVLLTTSTLMKMGPLSSEAVLKRNAGHQGGGKMPTSLPGGADNSLVQTAQMTANLEEQQKATIDALAARRVAQEQEAAQVLAKQQLAAQQATAAQEQAIAAEKAKEAQLAQQVTAQQNQPASAGGGPQGNQGQKPGAPPGQQHVPPGQAKK